MLALLLDENLSPTLTSTLSLEGVEAVHIRDRGLLQASDPEVWRLAQKEARAIVTVNRGDFVRLADDADFHYGVMVLPGGVLRARQTELVMSGIHYARKDLDFEPNLDNRVIEVGEDGSIAEIRRKPPRIIGLA